MEIRNNLKFSQRFEYGIYQFLDHFFTRKVVQAAFGKSRKRLFKSIHDTLKESGEGKVLEIERRKNITDAELKEFIRLGKPVILEGYAKDWPCVKKWSFEYFDKLHGEDEILVVNSKHIDAPYEKITLSELIKDINNKGSKYYRFYPLLSEHPEHLVDLDYNWLKSIRHKKVMIESFQVFMGGKDTESPLHNAMGCNLFIQVVGEKRWSIMSPHHTAIVDPDPIRNIYRGAPFRKNNYPFNPFKPDFEKPYELFKYVDRYDFVLKPGDILWNPPYWWHAVVNQSESIGIGYRWVPHVYSFKQHPLYALLDHLAMNPPMWKGYKLSKKDTNLVHLAEDGRLNKYLKKKGITREEYFESQRN